MVSKTLAKHPWLWTKLILATKFSPGVKVVAFAMVQCVNKAEACGWTSQKNLGLSCDQTESTVRHAIAALRYNGLITVERRGYNKSNRFYLSLAPGLSLVATVKDGREQINIVGTAKLTYRAEKDPKPKKSTVPAVARDRPDGANIHGTVGTPNLLERNFRTELRKKENNQNSFLTDSQSDNIIIFPNRLAGDLPIESCPKQPPIQQTDIQATSATPSPTPVTDIAIPISVPNDLLRRETSDDKAVRAIRRAAMNHLGIGPTDRSLGSGFRDQQVISSIPEKTMAGLVQKCRQGKLSRSEIGQTLADAGIGPKLDLARCGAA
jgi:DNA-binding transcriptional ArsR family regulator